MGMSSRTMRVLTRVLFAPTLSLSLALKRWAKTVIVGGFRPTSIAFRLSLSCHPIVTSSGEALNPFPSALSRNDAVAVGERGRLDRCRRRPADVPASTTLARPGRSRSLFQRHRSG